MLARLLALLLLPCLLVSAQLSCSRDADCTSIRPHCQDAVCVLLVSTGEFCSQHADCASFDTLLDSACTATCNIEAACQNNRRKHLLEGDADRPNPKVFGQPSSTQHCCKGVDKDQQCSIQREIIGNKSSIAVSSDNHPALKLYHINSCALGLSCTLPDQNSQSATCQKALVNNGWVVGVIISLCSSVVLNLGTNVQKYAFRKNQALPEGLHLPSYRMPMWILGFFLWISGNLGSFVALSFAAQSLIAPLGAVALIVNAVAAPLINKEPFGKRDIVSILFITAGTLLVVVFANHEKGEYSLCALLSFYRRSATIIYLVLMGALILLLGAFIRVVERHRLRHINHGHSLDRALSVFEYNPPVITTEDSSTLKKESPPITSTPRFRSSDQLPQLSSPSIISTGVICDPTEQTPNPINPIINPKNNGKKSILQWLHLRPFHKAASSTIPVNSPDMSYHHKGCKSAIIQYLHKRTHSSRSYRRPPMRIPFLDTIIVPPNEFVMRVLLPFSYACIGGVMGGLTIMFAKSTAVLIDLTSKGQNQFIYLPTYLILLGILITGFGQIYYINEGLKKYDALLQVPAFFVVYTLCGIISGGVYFDDFAGFTPAQYAFFASGVTLTFIGVAVLAGRLKKSSSTTNSVEISVDEDNNWAELAPSASNHVITNNDGYLGTDANGFNKSRGITPGQSSHTLVPRQTNSSTDDDDEPVPFIIIHTDKNTDAFIKTSYSPPHPLVSTDELPGVVVSNSLSTSHTVPDFAPSRYTEQSSATLMSLFHRNSE